MDKQDFKNKKRFGQNFLTNGHITEKIAAAANPSLSPAGKGVLEIGPGSGNLTRKLSPLFDKVFAVEIDVSLESILAKLTEAFPNVGIKYGDILKTDIKKICGEQFPGMEISVCANIPYYITSPILMHLLESGIVFNSIVLMVQKEIAQRLAAEPGTKDYSVLTLAVKYYGKVEKIITVGRNNFYPTPKVDSAVIKITPHDTYKDTPPDLLFPVIKGAFSQRRKKLVNALSPVFENMDRQTLTRAIEKSGIDPGIRGECLSLEQHITLCGNLYK